MLQTAPVTSLLILLQQQPSSRELLKVAMNPTAQVLSPLPLHPVNRELFKMGVAMYQTASFMNPLPPQQPASRHLTAQVTSFLQQQPTSRELPKLGREMQAASPRLGSRHLETATKTTQVASLLPQPLPRKLDSRHLLKLVTSVR